MSGNGKTRIVRAAALATVLVVTVLLLAAAPAALAQQGGHAGHGDHAAADPHAHHRAAAQGAGGAGLTALAVTDLRPRMEIPDVVVVDQAGAERHFYRDLVAGKTVAVNFVFTTCTTICPPMGANFARLRRELGERAGRDLHLISVSIDPVTDTPERLAAWAEKFGAGPGWTLVTGDRAEITRLLKALEVFTPDPDDHAPTVLIGNGDAGNWTRAHGLATPAKLGELLKRADAEAEGRG